MEDGAITSKAEFERALAPLRAGLRRAINDEPPPPTAEEPEPPAALQFLVRAFDLSPFERDVLLLCAGVELDPDIAALCAEAHGDADKRYATFALAQRAFGGGHWSAAAPGGALAYWRLVRSDRDQPRIDSALAIDPRIVEFMIGLPGLDQRLGDLVSLQLPPEILPGSHAELARGLAELWRRTPGAASYPVVQLWGASPEANAAVAAAAADAVGWRLVSLPAPALPQPGSDLSELIRRLDREALLLNAVIHVEHEWLEPMRDAQRAYAARFLIERLHGAVVLTARERLQAPARPSVAFEVKRPSPAEQKALWAAAVGPAAAALAPAIERLAATFVLSPPEIAATWQEARIAPPADAEAALWQAARIKSRRRLDHLAQLIEPAAGWDALVLPQRQLAMLQELVAQVRRRDLVYDTWGFGNKSARGLGITALFTGVSGTGKTLAAEIIANELKLDLYRIDLSAVVDKYIGETEKNIRRIFDGAEAAGAVLLFDEADALFGKRTETKDSHDRYANIQVSYLLQKMESYRGLAILTSNIKSAIDSGFARRLRFTIEFPHPDMASRAEIWRRTIPGAAPTQGISYARLGQLNVTGGNISNIALNAAFLAAEAGEPLRMSHLLAAARNEFRKLDRPLTEQDIRGWA